MKKLWISLAVFAIAVPSLALAATFQADSNLPAGEVVVGNLYMAGSTPTVNGDVQGDLYVAGGNVIVSGIVVEDLVAAGGNISLTGRVGGDVRAFGGSIFIDSIVDGEVISSGGDVKIGPNAQIRKDLVVSGGSVEVDPNAKVFGTKRIETGEKAEGKYDGMAEPLNKFTRAAFWFGQIFMVLSYFVIAALFLGLFPNFLKKWAGRAYARGQFWPMLGLGFLMLIVTPVLAVILLMTGVGALLGGLLLMAYVAYILLSIALAGVLFGELLKKWFAKAKKVEPSWGWGLGGIALLHVVSLIPFVGWLIGLAFFLLGAGALAAVKWQIARSLR